MRHISDAQPYILSSFASNGSRKSILLFEEVFQAEKSKVWVTRNLKFYPLSIRSAMKKDGPLSFIADTFEIETCLSATKLMKDLTKWELLNLRTKAILDIPERLYGQYHMSPSFLKSVMQDYGIQSTGKGALEQEFGVKPMKYFVSSTRHYSWPKAAGKLPS